MSRANMDLKNIDKILKNEPAFRLKQIKHSLFVGLIDSWQKATTLPKALREKLDGSVDISIKSSCLSSQDEMTTKALITLEDGLKIETVLMKHSEGRNTVCVSSQIGCPLGCTFCATGRIGFKRNLSAYEIAEQVLFFARLLKEEKRKITNVVFMGMGEPFLNWENVLEAVKIINDKDGLNIGARHISISTIGIIEGIEKLSEEKLQVNLAISLNAADNKLRSKLVPINKKYPIEKILDAVDRYIEKTKRKVMFEYIMIQNVNDSGDEALKLAKLMKRKLYLVNLISYNPTGIFKPSSGKRIKEFKEILKRKGIAVTQRYRFGDRIEAACGQLVGN